MSSIILDCDLMRFPNSGLYHYCLNLGLYVNKLLDQQGRERMKFYVPPAERDSFDKRSDTIVEQRYHRFYKPFLWDCTIWHAPFQTGRIIPYYNRNIKVVLTIHDLNFLHEGKPPGEQRKNLSKTQWLIDRSDAVVCISDFVRQDVLKNCDVGNTPIHVIHNGTHRVGVPQLDPGGYQPQRPFLFGIGYVNRKKNFHTLLSLLEYNEDVELVVAGRLDEPDYVEMMIEDAKKRGIGDRLKVLGPVSENDKAWYLKHCTAYLHPSLAEGFGATVVEAMGFGKPLFLSHLTSLPEIGGDVAFFFKSFEPEHMRQVFRAGMMEYSKNGLAQRIVERGKVFDWHQKAVEYLNLYNSLL